MKQGMPANSFQFTQAKRAAISELLSIAELSQDLHTHEVISSRLRELLNGSRPWMLDDDSIKAVLQKLINRWEAEQNVNPKY